MMKKNKIGDRTVYGLTVCCLTTSTAQADSEALNIHQAECTDGLYVQ